MLPAVRAQPYTASAGVYTGRGLWFGYTISNAHATDITTVTFYDGVGTGGTIIGIVKVAAGAAAVAFPGAAAVRTESGLYFTITGGTATVVPYYMTQTRLLTGLTLFNDEDRNIDSLGLLKLMQYLSDHGMSISLPDAGEQ